MLGTEHDRVDANRSVLLVVLDGHLRFAIGTKVQHLFALFADTRQGINERVSEVKRQRHIVIGLVCRKTEHHSLVSCALLFRYLTAHTHIDIRGLCMQGGEDAATLCLELILRFGVTYLSDSLTSDLLDIHPSFATHLTGNHHLSGGTQRLASYVCLRILSQHIIQNSVRNLVAHFIGVSFRHRF